MTMNDFENFALMVSEDVKNKADQQTKDMLRLPENWERWRKCLIDIIENVSSKIDELDENILALRSTYSDFVSDPAASLENQREKSNRFRFYAEKRLAEVDRMIKLNAEPDPTVSLASFLRDAISFHRQNKISAGSYDTIDEVLWDSLDGKWSF